MDLNSHVNELIKSNNEIASLYAYQTKLISGEWETFVLTKHPDHGELSVITSDKRFNESKRLLTSVYESFNNELLSTNFWKLAVPKKLPLWVYQISVAGFERSSNATCFSEYTFTETFPEQISGIREVFATLTGAYILGQRPGSLTRTLTSGYTYHRTSQDGKNQLYVQIDLSRDYPGIIVRRKFGSGIENIPILFKDPGNRVELLPEERALFMKHLDKLGIGEIEDMPPTSEEMEDAKLYVRVKGSFKVLNLHNIPKHLSIRNFFEKVANNPENWQNFI